MTALEMPEVAQRRASRDAAVPRYSVVGPDDAPVVVVLGGISATRHVTGDAGWWGAIAGPGRAIDTNRRRVLGLDFLDGGRDSTGRPRRVVSTHDQALWVARILRSIGVPRAHAIVGSSYGGMVALAFVERYPDLVERAIVIGAAHRSHPMSTALRTIQRRTVELGLDTGRVGEAMSIARGLAMTTYRTAREFGERFACDPINGRFDVGDYLRDRGDRFARVMRPERFLALSLSADLHRVDPTLITVPVTVVSAEGDAIVPAGDTDALAAALPRLAAHRQLITRVGHDAFLVETAQVSSILASTLS